MYISAGSIDVFIGILCSAEVSRCLLRNGCNKCYLWTRKSTHYIYSSAQCNVSVIKCAVHGLVDTVYVVQGIVEDMYLG